MIGLLVLLRCHIAFAALDGHLHVQFSVLVERRDVKIGIQDLDIGIGDDVRRRDFLLALDVETKDPRLFAVHLEAERLEVQHDVRHIIADARDGGKLVQYAVDADRSDRRARQG